MVAFSGLLLSGCSKNSTYEPPEPISGYIYFYNTTEYYSITITRVDQRRGTDQEHRTYNNTIVNPNQRRQIENLIDGNYMFEGGDDVMVTFESTYQESPGHPLFHGTVTLTVNGNQHVRVKGQDGQYDISGQ
jgi:ribosomal protein L21E